MRSSTPSRTPILLTCLLLLTSCCSGGSKPAPDEPKPPVPIVVQPRPMPCRDPGPQPTAPDRLGLIWRAADGVYQVERDPVLKLTAYLVDAWMWMDAAEACIEAQRRATEAP